MIIKLVGALPEQLRDMGFKPGEIYEAYSSENTRLDAVKIQKVVDGTVAIATVYLENYKKI
jgi:hypothetical protein